MSDFHSLRKVLQGMWREGGIKKPKTGDQCIDTTRTRKHYWLLMALMLPQMTHPSIHNTSVPHAMQQQGDVKAAVSIGVRTSLRSMSGRT